MAKKNAPTKTSAPAIAAKAKSTVVASTPVRNTPIPKVAKATVVAAPMMKNELTHDQIARRAFEIHCSGTGGSEGDNWFRAERELRGL